MAIPTEITTGEQSVSAVGAVTGVLSTSALSGDFTIKVRVRGMTAGQGILLSVQDTANATPFSDANAVAVAHVPGGAPVEGVTFEWRTKDIPFTRFGAANTALRVFCQLLYGTSPTAEVLGWIEQ